MGCLRRAVEEVLLSVSEGQCDALIAERCYTWMTPCARASKSELRFKVKKIHVKRGIQFVCGRVNDYRTE